MQSIQKHNSVNCYESGLSLRDCFKSPGTVSDAFSGVNLRLSFWRKESIGPPTCDGSLGCLLPLLLLTVTGVLVTALVDSSVNSGMKVVSLTSSATVSDVSIGTISSVSASLVSCCLESCWLTPEQVATSE